MPTYDVGDIVYLRESAAIGYLEPLKISGLSKSSLGWVYTVVAGGSSPYSTYGDRKSLINGAILYYTESEFVSLRAALDLAYDYAIGVASRIDAQRNALFPDTTEN